MEEVSVLSELRDSLKTLLFSVALVALGEVMVRIWELPRLWTLLAALVLGYLALGLWRGATRRSPGDLSDARDAENGS